MKRESGQQFQSGDYQIRPMGSVAYKLALVAAGLADITFTLTPKNEWDVAAGAALVASSGGFVSHARQYTATVQPQESSAVGLAG